jgi:hypothetical protein
MITREEYSKALDIVESYHQQIKKDTEFDLSWDSLKRGDYITFDKSISKYIDENVRYKVISVRNDWKESHYAWFDFFDKNNKVKSLRKFSRGYIMRKVL